MSKGEASSDDGELLRRVAAEDVEALAELYDRHAATLLGVAVRILRDRSLAEDLIHDVFVGLYERAPLYDPSRGSVRTWLASATRNLGIDRLRQRASQRRVSAAASAEAATDNRNTDTPFTDGHQVTSAVSRLPLEQRVVIEAAYFDGLSYSEIADREQVPLGTVKSRAARAMITLRAALADTSPGSDPPPQPYILRDPKGAS